MKLKKLAGVEWLSIVDGKRKPRKKTMPLWSSPISYPEHQKRFSVKANKPIWITSSYPNNLLEQITQRLWLIQMIYFKHPPSSTKARSHKMNTMCIHICYQQHPNSAYTTSKASSSTRGSRPRRLPSSQRVKKAPFRLRWHSEESDSYLFERRRKAGRLAFSIHLELIIGLLVEYYDTDNGTAKKANQRT